MVFIWTRKRGICVNSEAGADHGWPASKRMDLQWQEWRDLQWHGSSGVDGSTVAWTTRCDWVHNNMNHWIYKSMDHQGWRDLQWRGPTGVIRSNKMDHQGRRDLIKHGPPGLDGSTAVWITRDSGIYRRIDHQMWMGLYGPLGVDKSTDGPVLARGGKSPSVAL